MDWDARSSSGTDGWRRRDWKQLASSVRETLIRLFNTVEQQAADMTLQELQEHAAWPEDCLFDRVHGRAGVD